MLSTHNQWPKICQDQVLYQQWQISKTSQQIYHVQYDYDKGMVKKKKEGISGSQPSLVLINNNHNNNKKNQIYVEYIFCL